MNASAMLPVALDLSLKSSFVVILAWLSLRTWRSASAAQRGYIWCAAFAVLIALPFTRLVAPHWKFSFSGATSGNVAHVEPAIMISSSEIRDGSGDISAGAPVADRKPIDGTLLVFGVWIGGIFSALVYRAMGTWQLRRCLRASVPLRDDACEELAISISTDFALARSVDVRVSRDCLVPMTWGTWRPVILLPSEALTWPRAWMEAALRHEMGHVKNRDHLKRLAAFLTCAFYWPNPFVWMAARQLQLAQEEASDNLVLEVEILPQEYAAQLIEVIRSLASGRAFSMSAVSMARCSTLEGRLAAILDEKRNRRDAEGRLAALGIGFAAVLLIALGTVQLRAANSELPGEAPFSQPDPGFTAAVNGLKLPPLDFKETGAFEIVDALRNASAKANPQGLPVRFWVWGFRSKMNLRLDAGSLKGAITAFAKATGLQYEIAPLYEYRLGDDNTLQRKLKEVMCAFWPHDSSLPLFDREFVLSEKGARILQLKVGGDSTQVEKDLGRWGIQFPQGTRAVLNTVNSTSPGLLTIESQNNYRQLMQILELMFAVQSPGDFPTPAKKASPDSSNVTFIATPADDAGRATERKLQAIIIDHVDFKAADVADVLKFFTRKSREFDPDKLGLNFVLGDLSHPTPQNHFHRPVTILLDNVPLEDLLGYVVQQTNLKCSIDKNTVYFNLR